MAEEIFLTALQAAKALGVHPSAVRDLIRLGMLSGKKNSESHTANYKIPLSAVLEYQKKVERQVAAGSR